ncbi:MAG: lipopolysaccharide heptosyltransferase I, partial [Thermoanaerobaculia bacterium]
DRGGPEGPFDDGSDSTIEAVNKIADRGLRIAQPQLTISNQQSAISNQQSAISDPQSAMSSLLILRLSALGDVIHTLPAVAELRRALPERKLVWAVEAPYRELVETVAPVDQVVGLSTKKWRKSPFAAPTHSSVRALAGELRSAVGRGDAIDFQGLVKSAMVGWWSGARLRFGFDASAIREKAALLFLNRRMAVPEGLHVVDINRALARGVVAALGGAEVGEVEPDLSAWPADPSGELAPLMRDRPVVLVPGAGRPGKQWNIDRFRSLAAFIEDGLRLPVVIAWGPGERHLADGIAEGGKGMTAPPTTLRELAFVLSRARLVVAGDTGPLHLAAALGADVVGLFGPTDPRRNGPYGQIPRCVESYSGSRTMEEIGVERVIERVQEVLG